MTIYALTGFTSADKAALRAKIIASGHGLSCNVNGKTDIVLAGSNCGPVKYAKAVSAGLPVYRQEKPIYQIKGSDYMAAFGVGLF